MNEDDQTPSRHHRFYIGDEIIDAPEGYKRCTRPGVIGGLLPHSMHVHLSRGWSKFVSPDELATMLANCSANFVPVFFSVGGDKFPTIPIPT
jgi:hypothetical protein